MQIILTEEEYNALKEGGAGVKKSYKEAAENYAKAVRHEFQKVLIERSERCRITDRYLNPEVKDFVSSVCDAIRIPKIEDYIK